MTRQYCMIASKGVARDAEHAERRQWRTENPAVEMDRARAAVEGRRRSFLDWRRFRASVDQRTFAGAN